MLGAGAGLAAALVCVSPAPGGELQWRKPAVAAASATEERSADRSAASSGIAEVRPVAHQEEGEIEGPRLVPAGERKEPRKLRSVLVRSPASQPSPARLEPQEDQQARPLALPDRNVLRGGAKRNSNPRPGRPVEKDPFEQTADWTSRNSSVDRAVSPVQLTQSEVTEQPTRSVLVRDPFEGGEGTTGDSGTPTFGDRFASQPLPLDDSADAQPLGEEEEPGLGFQRFSEEPFGTYSQDRSLEAERARAEETCKEALAVLERDRISTIDLGIRVPGEVGVDFPFECSLDTGEYEPRAWSGTTFMWKASALCHKPLYFENVALERYGHSWGWHLQPFVSAAHFFTTVPILPYKMGLTPPNECIYALGYYRPGNCAPYLIEPLGTHPRAVVWQAGAIVGAAAIVP